MRPGERPRRLERIVLLRSGERDRAAAALERAAREVDAAREVRDRAAASLESARHEASPRAEGRLRADELRALAALDEEARERRQRLERRLAGAEEDLRAVEAARVVAAQALSRTEGMLDGAKARLEAALRAGEARREERALEESVDERRLRDH